MYKEGIFVDFLVVVKYLFMMESLEGIMNLNIIYLLLLMSF